MRVGADEVVYPNRDIAEKLAVKLNSKRVFDYVELDAEHGIFEIAVPQRWYGKNLKIVADSDNARVEGRNVEGF